MTNNPRPLPKYPIQSLGVTPTVCLAGMEACIMLEDISYSLLLAWSTDLKGGLSPYNPLELQRIKAVTRRGIWDMKAVEFSCVSNQFTTSFVSWKMVSYEESMGIFCKLSKNWQRIWRAQCCLGASGCCCRQDVPQWRFRVAVVNRAAPSLQEK